MSLQVEIEALSSQITERLDASREFYVHTRQAWRLVEKVARKGRPVGIVDLTTRQSLSADDLGRRAQRYATVRLAESVFRDLSGLMEDWFIGVVRAWLTAHPEDLDLNFDPVTGQHRARRTRRSRSPSPRSFTCGTQTPCWADLSRRLLAD